MYKKYIKTEIVEAKKCKAWENSGLHKIGDDGYKVVYEDGYESWLPAYGFEGEYKEVNGLTFGLALEALKKGYKLRRKGWNGKGIFIKLAGEVNAESIAENVRNAYAKDFDKETAEAVIDNMTPMTHPYIYIDTTELQTNNADALKCRIPWLASQTDMLSADWEIVD